MWPEGVSRVWICATASSVSIRSAPVTVRTFRRSASAQAPPRRLGLVLIAPAGLPSRTAAPRGREAQSRAFFSWPGMVPLYSGVAMSRAPAPAMS